MCASLLDTASRTKRAAPFGAALLSAFFEKMFSAGVLFAYWSSWSTPCGAALACANMAVEACTRMLFFV